MTSPSSSSSSSSSTPGTDATQAKAANTGAVASADTKAQAKDNTAADGSNVSADYFTNPDVKALTQLPTAKDHMDIERITGVTRDGWQHPPSELSEDEIKAAEEREEFFKASQDVRLSGGANSKPLTSDESGAANASQGVGGSGSA